MHGTGALSALIYVQMIALLLMIDTEAGSSPPPPLQGAILIILDTVRADRLSSYGHHRATSPNIDELAARGVLFEEVISSAPWTLPSLASMLSGRWLAESFEFDNQSSRLRDSVVESIRRAGYETAAFTEGGFMSKYFGFDRGFSTYREETAAVRRRDDEEIAGEAAEGSIQSTFRAARSWLRENASKKFFLLIHTYEAHTPYRRHHFTQNLDPGEVGSSLELEALWSIRLGKLATQKDEQEYVRALYDSGILEADRYVKELLVELTALGLRDKTLIVITSDHGEELGDHYPLELANHGHSLKDDQLRVPLIISHPGIDYPVKRVRQAARTIDILPTIADLLKVPLKQPVDGKSLTLFMLGADPRERVVFGGSVDYGPLRSFVRTPQFKYIEVTGENVTGEGDTELNPMPDRIQLYDLDVDPKEMNNIADSRPEVAARLGEMLRKHQEGTSERVHGNVLPSVLRERLRSLGYLPMIDQGE